MSKPVMQGDPLSAREAEVVSALVAGHTTNADLARVLVLSERTVQTHLYTIFLKTGAQNKADLVLMVWGRKRCTITLADLRREPRPTASLGPLPTAHPVIQ